jgi:hypothetical protein
MKSLVIAIAFFAVSPAFAQPKPVAKCGNYTLLQDVFSTYFAGILHEANIYEIAVPAGDQLPADFHSNSEGAVLTATRDIDVNPANGQVLRVQTLTIDATWGNFTLTIDDQGQKTSIRCTKTN